MAGPGLDQGAVHREMFLAQQVAPVGQRHHFGEEALDHGMFEQAVAVVADAGVVPDLVVDG